MNRRRRLPWAAKVLAASLAAAITGLASAQQIDLQQTWETGYEGKDLTGAHVLGCWKFDAGNALADSSGKGNDLTLQGAVLNANGRFGGALESFPGFPVQSKRHGAMTGAKPPLSPKGAFTFEMWIQPKEDFDPKLRCHLLDKKYVDNTDYQWGIGEADKAGLRRMWMTLGFGAESKTIYSEQIKLTADEWQHVAFTYDGAGNGKFYRNGEAAGGALLIGYGAITPGTKPLSIGDRIGSNYGGFPGLIDEVRICDGVLNFEQARMQIVSNRTVWRRMETTKPVEVICTNLRRDTLRGATLRLSFGGKEETFTLPDLPSGKSFPAKFSINSALKPQRYVLRARLEINEGKAYATEQSAEFEITPRPAPRMPVIMWGANPQEAAKLKELGFTHCLGIGADYGAIWNANTTALPAKADVVDSNRRMLDQALSNDIGVIASLSPGRWLEHNPANLRIDRNGKPFVRQDICASIPEFAPFFEKVGRSVTKAYGDHPAFAAALIDTEVRDASQPSFNPVDLENYRKFAGTDIPAEITLRSGVDWTKLPEFPADRVLEDDHPILKYYRWFWTVGDGWNALHSALNKGIKSANRRDFFTFYDPAVRQPSISGSGGTVDVLSHWTYTYPDPQRIGLCADQLMAMSEAGGRRQQIMKMTQLIWYRSQTAPTKASAPENPVAWEDHDPEAAYITIAPMHLRAALWAKIARPVQGIMYHGWNSLVNNPQSTSGYRYTNPNTEHVLKELIHEVIQPLGPALMQIPDEPRDVALLESFSSQMFGRRGGYGNNLGWSADVWLALQHAHVPTDILYEETLLKNGLTGRKVLIMPECDVLTKSVVARIQEWQKKGGKVVADEFLCPALKADVVLTSFKRMKKADADKARVLDLAKTLGPQISNLGWEAKITCDNPDIIVRTRRFGDALYVFVVNDQREFGNYVGQHGLVMENGLPSSGMLTLKQEQANIYDLTRSSFIVPKRGEADGVSWRVDLGPSDGRIFMVTPKPLLAVNLEVPETATVGNTAKITATVTTTQDIAVKAVVPMRVDIRDANGKSAEGSGYYAAVNGLLTLDVNVAPNEDPGVWEFRMRDLASGMEVVKWMRVAK